MQARDSTPPLLANARARSDAPLLAERIPQSTRAHSRVERVACGWYKTEHAGGKGEVRHAGGGNGGAEITKGSEGGAELKVGGEGEAGRAVGGEGEAGHPKGSRGDADAEHDVSGGSSIKPTKVSEAEFSAPSGWTVCTSSSKGSEGEKKATPNGMRTSVSSSEGGEGGAA